MFIAVCEPDRHYCPKCGAQALRPSRRRSLGDYLLSLIGLQPVRCHRCLFRCRAFRLFTGAAA